MLPDYLEPDLRLVLVGTAVGEQSATRGHYYAGHGNSFWKFVHEAALTPTRLEPLDDATLPRYGMPQPSRIGAGVDRLPRNGGSIRGLDMDRRHVASSARTRNLSGRVTTFK